MSSLTDHLAAIEKKIADADRRVEQQLGLIEELIQDGNDALSAPASSPATARLP
jgi:hypothetical protein